MSDATTTDKRKIIQPQYQKLSIIMLGLVALFYALSFAEPIIVPVLFALLLAMLLNPVVNFMVRMRVPRILAIALSVLLAMVTLAGLGYFIVTQAGHFSETLPQLKEKLDALMSDGQRWAQQVFNMRSSEVKDAVEKVKDEGMAKGGSFVGQTLTTVGTLFAFFFLLPVFTFLLLLYKRLLITFISKLFPADEQDAVSDVLGQTKGVVQSYLVGLIFEAAIVTVLNWVGLMLIGVEYALLLAVIGAVLNLIPYVGMIIATILPMVVALATLEPTAALWVLGLYAFVQFLDNNFIVPNVVASRVQLNALVSILVVMVGGALWGIPGMFLAIPITAMLKVIFDRVPGLEPFGYVLGDDDPKNQHALFRLPRSVRKGKT
ncbi:MAG: AI-2E family transporter [Flavobacteriales bacterium]|nr:AI-2E family transporter [Flavobacteriales bacterium]